MSRVNIVLLSYPAAPIIITAALEIFWATEIRGDDAITVGKSLISCLPRNRAEREHAGRSAPGAGESYPLKNPFTKAERASERMEFVPPDQFRLMDLARR